MAGVDHFRATSSLTSRAWPAVASQLAFVGTVALVTLARAASAETYYSDPSVEVSGTGMPGLRSCTVLFRPKQTVGDDLAPRLALVTSGQSRLSLNIEQPGQYSSPVIVQNNVRSPLVPVDGVSAEQFQRSDLSKILRSQRTFFVTAQRGDTERYVSSRYDRLNLDAVLSKIETYCSFDVESLLTDLSSRQRAEQALSISMSDLTLMRWALLKRYAGQSTKPDQTFFLSPPERVFLKRYAADNGLVISQYLTGETARRLLAEGVETANAAAIIEESARPASMTPPGGFESEFIFPDSQMRLLTSADINGRSTEELRIARNEIFARRGRYFNAPDLVARFSKFAWYAPNTWNPTLNSIEAANVQLLSRSEDAKGWASDFIIPDSGTRLLTAQELNRLSKSDLRIAKNEIFARKGRYFESAELKSHFSRFSWYAPNTWNPKLSSIEEANAALIASFEKR